MFRSLIAVATLLAATLAQAQTVKLITTEGEIRIELDAEKAPKTVANFLQYVKAGHYNGTVFHRVIENFMIQGGGYDAKLNQRPTKPPIPLESANGLLNLRGTIAMARMSEPNTANSQFFINVVDNAFLNRTEEKPGYAVFGKVIEGMDVVDKIRVVPVAPQGVHQHFPVTPILITKALIEPTPK
jgi:peptidyl-prolyl cis-trans isomerase A (cyclophilin A)